jgi:hypothetical protein
MTLEQYIARLNTLAFWKEFTFAKNRFAPQPGGEVELADNFVWLGNHAYVLQLKEREEESDNPEVERTWFRRKVIGKATKQIRDTLRFLGEHQQISITNERGYPFEIRCAELTEITKVVVFVGGRALPEECWRTRYHVSKTAGFIHVVALHDYLGILEKLRVPEDIRRYFAYREEVAPKLASGGVVVDESDIMGAFLQEEAIPAPGSREKLRRFVQDLDAFDLSKLIGSLHDNIQNAAQPHDYYQIMLEFAHVPRSVWREVKARLTKSLEVVQKGEFSRPFRLAFPATGCAFMIAPLDPQLPATGAQGERTRMTGLRNLTHAAMYDTKVSKGVGILISKDGEHIQIDWSLVNAPWEPDPEMDARLAASNPFREAKEKMVNSFLFVSTSEGS